MCNDWRKYFNHINETLKEEEIPWIFIYEISATLIGNYPKPLPLGYYQKWFSEIDRKTPYEFMYFMICSCNEEIPWVVVLEISRRKVEKIPLLHGWKFVKIPESFKIGYLSPEGIVQFKLPLKPRMFMEDEVMEKPMVSMLKSGWTEDFKNGQKVCQVDKHSTEISRSRKDGLSNEKHIDVGWSSLPCRVRDNLHVKLLPKSKHVDLEGGYSCRVEQINADRLIAVHLFKEEEMNLQHIEKDCEYAKSLNGPGY
jgi:hypothetical protein